MTEPVQWTFDRDDIKWVGPITVTDVVPDPDNPGQHKTVVITDYTLTVVRSGSRPTAWLAPNVEPGGTDLGVRVGTTTGWPLTATPGLYLIRACIVDADETESVVVGQIRTT